MSSVIKGIYDLFYDLLVGACIDIKDILLGGNVSAPTFCTIGSMFDGAVLVHINLLLFIIYCWPLTFPLQPIL